MFAVAVNTRRAVVGTKELITTGSAGIQVQFGFSEDWDDLSKFAVFRNGEDPDTGVTVALDANNKVALPAQNCAAEYVDEAVFCGVYGTDGLGTVIIPTIWVSIGVLREGVSYEGVTPAEPTPDMWAQMLEIATTVGQDAEAAAEAAQAAAESARDGAVTAKNTSEAQALKSEGYAVGKQGGQDVGTSSTYWHNNAKYYKEQAADSANNAANSEANASGSATAASGSASSAGTNALKAEGHAVGQQNGTDVDSGSSYYHNNSKYYSEQAASSATTASTKAGEASGSATTASNKAGEASASATAASGSASSASTNALKAEGYAVGKQNGEDVSSGSDYYHANAKYYSEQAGTSATNAGTSETNASGSASSASTNALKAEGFAVGEQNGEAVASGSPYYHNNAEYFAGEAASSATAAGNSATAAAASATAAETSVLGTNFAPTYSSSNTYAVGDYVLYNDALYRCTTAVTTAEAWTAAHWTATKIGPDVASLKSDLSLLRDVTDLSDDFVVGSYIYTNISIGDTVDITPVSNSGFKYQIIPCYKGDTFIVTIKGGGNPRAWAFTDGEYRLLSKASVITVTDVSLTASSDGYLILNTTTDITSDVKLYRFATINLKNDVATLETDVATLKTDVNNITGAITHITNPHYLFWRMGSFDSNGAQNFANGMLATDRFFTIVKLKAGSTISKKDSIVRTKNISFGYKLSESDSTLSGFQSNAGNSITIAQDCIAYIGIRYSNPVADLLDDSILDEFDFDLYVIDYKSRYARGHGVKDVFIPQNGYAFPRNYGIPCPEIYYEGQHTDTTGWTNSFSDIAAVYTAFDALVTASDGYFTKKNDYGIAYTGNAGNTSYDASSEWHLYEYSTFPTNPSNETVPKVAITCAIHGNEKMATYAAYYLIYDLIYNAEKNPVLSWLKSNCIITFIPICNPYGFMKETPSRLNENGVNLNRNFPTYNWSTWDGTGSESGGMNYKGASAASETETQYMMKFYRNNYDAVFAIDLHTNGADTISRDMVSAYMRALPQDSTDKNYGILDSFLPDGKTFTIRLRPWLNGKYSAGLSYASAVGTTNPIDYFPCAPHWVRETAGLVGVCYELMAGSSTGFLGEQLTVYAPATIKAAAEELGNFIVTMLGHCKELN